MQGKRTLTPLLALCLLTHPSLSTAKNYGFDWDVLSEEMGLEMDAETFAAMQRELAVGHHRYDIYINNSYVGEETVEIFVSDVDERSLQVALPAKVIQKQALKREALRELYDLDSAFFLKDLTTYIPGATVDLDEGSQAVRVQIPQIYEDTRQRTFLGPELWDYGVPALRLSYTGDVSRASYENYRENTAFFSGDARLNLGRWRFSARGNLTYGDDEGWALDGYERHLSTLLPQWGAELKVGEFTTVGKYVSGIPIRGIAFFEDEEQIDPLDTDYLPVITGFANSAAQVTIRQGTRTLRQVDVAPGPFEFDDIRVVGNSGDIEVEVKEYTGRTTVMVVPYSSNHRLLKERRFSWSASVGRYDDGVSSSHPWVGQLSAGYGMPWGAWTLYGGLTVSEVFEQTLVGSAFDVGHWGGMSLQIEESRITAGRGRKGTAVEFAWNKYFELSESNFDLTYRHTMSGSIGSIGEALMLVNFPVDMYAGEINDFVRDEVTVSLSKTIGDWGSVSGSMLWSETESGRVKNSLSANWYFPMQSFNGSLQVQHSKEEVEFDKKDDDWSVSLRVDIPLERLGTAFAKSRVGLTAVQMDEGKHSKLFDFSSTFGAADRWNFNASVQKYADIATTVDTQLDYKSDFGRFGINWSYSKDQNRWVGRLAGGVLIAEGRAFLTDDMYGNVAIVSVPDGQTAQLKNSSKVGEVIVKTGLANFVENDIQLDPDSLPPNLTVIGGYEKRIIPADQAVVPVLFSSFKGMQAVFHVRMTDGSPLPYGALVTADDLPIEVDPSVTDESGSVYFAALPREGRLTARWREEGEVRECRIDYRLEGDGESAFEIEEMSAVCRLADETIDTSVPLPSPGIDETSVFRDLLDGVSEPAGW